MRPPRELARARAKGEWTVYLILERLRDDHRQLVRMLYHLDKAIKGLAGLSQSRAGLDKILDMLDYIQMYPEIWHHPVEDLICEHLLQKPIPDPEVLASCIEEHGILELRTENLHCYLDQLAAGDEAVRPRLLKAGSDYVRRQLMHMEHEQNTLFPLMEAYLDAGDWEQIRDRIQTRLRPEQEPRLQHYRQVYQAIADTSAVTAH